MGSGFGISGQPFVGADIGGFAGNSNAELFLRWMQYGTLTPFCRNHSEIGNVDQYAWSWGETIQDLVRTAIELRYRLLPYIYSAFVRSSETGEPIQRPMVFDFQYDGVVRDLDDQYLFGTDLLVAPVTAAGATSRQVYLPDGAGWYDWHSDELLDGGQFVVARTPMDRIPIFARGGAVVPMWTDAPPTTSGYHAEVVELHVFVPSRDGSHVSRLVEDDGLTTAAEGGASYRTTFVLERHGRELTLEARVEGDGYPEFRRQAFHVVVHGGAPSTLVVDGGEIPATDGCFVVPDEGAGFSARLTL
jgi:alpha-glucosidase